MGRYDEIFKFLGNEDSYAPEQIDSVLSKIPGVAELESEDDVSDENMANVDELLKSMDAFSGADLDELEEIKPESEEVIEDTPFTDDMGQAPEEDDFSAFGEEQAPPEDMFAGGGEEPSAEEDMFAGGGEEPSAEEDMFAAFGGGEESGDSDMDIFSDFGGGEESPINEDFISSAMSSGDKTPEEDAFSFGEESTVDEDTGAEDLLSMMSGPDEDELGEPTPPKKPEPPKIETIPEEDDEVEPNDVIIDGIPIDPDVLNEFNNLDSAPPSLEDIQRRAAGEETDMIKDIMEEEMGGGEGTQGEGDFDLGNFGIDEDTSQDIPEFGEEEEEGEGDVSDLLQRFTAEGGGEDEIGGGEPDLTDFGTPDETPMEDFDSGIDDLQDLLGESEMDLKQPSSESEDLLSEFGEEAPADLGPEESDEGVSDLMDLMEAPAEQGPLAPESSDELMEFGEEPSEEEGFDIPTEEEIGEPDSEFGMDDFEETGEGADMFDEMGFSEDMEDEFEEPSFDEDFDLTPDFDEEEMPHAVVEMPDIDMDEDKAIKIRNSINRLIDPDLRKKLRRVFLENLLPKEILELLIASLLLNEDESKIQELIDENLELEEEPEEEIEEEEEPSIPAERPRKVIYAEEAKRVQQFQKELGNITKYAAIAFIALVVLGFVFMKFILIPSQANKIYKEGLEHIKLKQYTSAEGSFTDAENKSGPKMEWYNKFALAYEDVGQYERAESKFIAALSNKPFHKETLLNFADYYKTKPSPDYDKALEKYYLVLDENEDDFEIVDLIGETLIERAEKDEDNAQDYLDEAFEVYSDYLFEEPGHIPSYMKLMLIALREDDTETANFFYETIDKSKGSNVDIDIFTELLEYYVDERELDRAKDVSGKLIPYIDKKIREHNRDAKNAPTLEETVPYGESYYQYARYLTVTMNYMKAMEAVSNAFILDDEHGRSYNLMGELFYLSETITNNVESALYFFQMSTNFAKDYYKPYANMGHIYFYEKLRFEDADTDKSLTKALTLYQLAEYYQPDDSEDFLLKYNLGWLYYHNENYQDAFERWYPLYTEEPFNPVLAQALGNNYFHMDPQQAGLALMQFEKSIEYYQDLADGIGYINPDLDRHIEIYTQLARCYNNRGVIYLMAANSSGEENKSYYEQQALLDFYRSKNAANEIDTIYEAAEYNIKILINQRGIEGRDPVFEETIPQRTTLQKWIDEFKQKLILTL